ncbi:MAG: hypothetical protein CBD60_01370 [Flavobacteriaceae bacterium TMED200]|nr:hypothetical protein [Flavobacteriaceae bacterium]OUW66585.1 MAG: hypothetical protein CBD60_01370 [Flavobacteriaceae bacterium TMED200]
MKKTLIAIIIFFNLSSTSCNKSKIVKVDDSINKEIFSKNVSIFNSAIEAFVIEDKVAFMKTFADSLKWSGPDKKTSNEFDSKEDLANAIAAYMENYDDHALKNTTFYGGSIYSTDKSNSNPNTGIRVYGDWYHKHTETGKEVSHKWMALIWFNEAGKIYEFRDFFDVNGFLSQHIQ